jgi:hypothetical protein
MDQVRPASDARWGAYPSERTAGPTDLQGETTLSTAQTTRYRGIRYRTTLEAKWAAFFHHLRWDHVYNPFADGTVSFVIHGGGEPFFVLVTDAVTEADYLDRGLDNDSGRDVVVVGVSPLPTLLDGGDAVGLLCREGDLGCAVVRWWSDGTLWFRVADDDRVFRRHGDVRAAWAKATNDIQAVA